MNEPPITLEKLLDSPELPSIPEALLQLNDLIKRDRPITQITEVIEREPSLSARSLELANSAWYKRSRTIATVQDAITTIGLDTLHQLVFATSVVRTFQGISDRFADMRSFWRQSLQLACNAKSIKDTSGEKNALLIFTAGIVTYIGKLIIYLNMPGQSQQILKNTQNHPERQHEEESKLLGFAHYDVSAGLLKKWNIPQALYVPIQYYTRPMTAPPQHQVDAATLFLAHQLVFKRIEDLYTKDTTNEISDNLALLHLNQNQLLAVQQQANAALSQAAAIIGVPIG